MIAPEFEPADLLPAISDYVFSHAGRHPERVAMRDECGELTYADLGFRVSRLAVALQRQGIKRGGRVAVLTIPRTDGYIVFLALNAMPLLPNGKLDKNALKQQARDLSV